MKVLKLLIIASILTYTAARVVGPQLVDSGKKTKYQTKQEDDEGVIVDPVITVSDIQVYENSSPVTTASSEENSVEISSSASAESTSTETESPVNEDDANPINRYCKCSNYECDCCRDFSLPLVPIRGPGCANIRYLEGDRMSVGIKFGNRVLANRVISGRKETPICLPLPGGFTNFCGRIYGISKKNEDFKACLGLELRADEEVEAALRVSCFSFGPKGLKVMEAEPIPVSAPVEEEDDDDDLFGFGGGDDDDEDDDILDDEDDTPTGQSAGNVPGNSPSADDDEEDEDYTGLSLLNGDILDDLLGGDDDDDSDEPAPAKKNTKKKPGLKLPGDDLGDVELSKPADDDDDDDEEEEEEEEEGGFLSLLDDLVSDGDEEEEDEEEKVEDEISEEIADNELEDAEEIVEDTEDTSPNLVKDNENQSQNDLEEQQFADAIDDDDDIDDDDEEEDEVDEKPSTYAGLSLLGLRQYFSRFFK